jgi:hypothetical protein
MEYAPYGGNGPMVSRLGFGVMRLPPTKGGGWGTVHFRKSVRILRQAFDAGVNFVDSHHDYHHGLSEVAIGKALKGWNGHRVYVQTKTPFYRDEPERWFKQRLEEALEKLGVNAIDYLFFHSMRMDMFRSRGKAFFRFTDWAIKKGYLRHRGFSSHDSPEHVRQFIDTGEFSAMLLSYNWQKPQMADTIAYGADKGMGVAVMNPVGGGLLASETPQIRRLLRAADSAPEIALRFVLSTPGVTLALSGMNTPEQVAENTRVADRKVPMTPRQRERMLDRMDKMQKEAAAVCTACGYCMPCPHGVDIPANFMLLNQARLFGLEEHARKRFQRLRTHKDGDKSARACVACRECVPKCPNDVDIPAQLRQTAELLSSG